MSVYMDAYGRYYAAESPKSTGDIRFASPSPQLEALLMEQAVPVASAEMAEVFAREADTPGFIEKYISDRVELRKVEVEVAADDNKKL